VALAAAYMGGCVESGKAPETLKGLARNTCGPTDGPAVEILVRKSGAGGCSDTGAVEARLNLEWIRVDSLVSGKTLLDSGWVCGNDSCHISSLYRLQIESAGNQTVHGTLETREKETNGSETIKRIDVDLTKCPSVMQLCG